MKRVFYFFFALIVLLSLNRATAQETISMAEIGVSVTIPAEWSEVKTYPVLDLLPLYGFYHVQENITGQFVAIRRDECSYLHTKGRVVDGSCGE